MQTQLSSSSNSEAVRNPYVGGATATAAARQIDRAAGSRPATKPSIELLPDNPLWHRMFDIAVAAVALIVFLPVMLLIALIVRLDSPGPVLFRQKRVGRNGELFTFTKFRTLYADARSRFPELYRYQYTPTQLDALHFKVMHDPRVTRAGKWLRASTLDELPNFWNVLTGDMALVGPRPEIPEMLPYYDQESLVKYAVRPGITGLAQTSGRGRLSFRDTVKLDIEYARTRNFAMDMKILFNTIHRIVLRDGAF